MIVPVFGYGLVAILLGHAYSRYALWNLKKLTRSIASDVPEGQDDPDTEGGGANE